MESANLLEASLSCCCRCKGLFNIQDDKLKHQINCMGNPMETTCAYFACERKIFLQLFQLETELDGNDPPFWFSKDDSFINHFVKIRVPDIFDPSIFLRSTTQPNQGDTDDSSFLLESNINTLEEEAEKSNGNSFLESSEQVSPINQEQIQSIINKNIEYLKNDDISSLSTEPSKVATSFDQSLPRILSPIDKHLQLFADGSKSRLNSPFEKSSGFLQEGQVGYSSGNFMYSSNPSLPFSCGLSTDLFSSIPPPQEENQQGFPTNIEEFPTLKYLDLAKKDPFFGQNLGLPQMNTKDPFLINASFKTAERPSVGLQKSQITRSCDDLQSSPMLPMQDGNYFNFPSTLDEPTQLDYLDLATLDFLTNPNLISFGTGVFKEKVYDREEGIYSEGNLTDLEQSGMRSETVARLSAVPASDNGDIGTSSAFSKVKKKKLRLKKSKSDMGKRHENATSGSRSFFAGFPDIREDLQQSVIKSGDNLISVHPKGSRSLVDASDFRISRKRKLDTPRESKGEAKLMKMNRKSSESLRISKSDKVINVSKHLTHLTEEQKNSMKAVIGQSGCIFVKKKRSLSCDEPVVYVNDYQVFEDIDIFGEHSKFDTKPDKFQPVISNPKVLSDKQCKTGKLTSVLQLKCQECDFRCRSVVELKNHCGIHTKSNYLEPSALEMPQLDKPQTMDLFIGNQTGSEMMQEGLNCSVIEITGKDTKIPSELQNTINTTLTDKSSVLQQTNGLFTASNAATEGAENVIVVSMSTSNTSERGQSVFENGVVICETAKIFAASQPKAVSLLPRKITDMSTALADCSLKKPNFDAYHNNVDCVESFSVDMNKETAIAVQAIEDINIDCENIPDQIEVMSLQDSCFYGPDNTGNMVKEISNDMPKEEMHVVNCELEGVQEENVAGHLNCGNKITFDYEFTAVPLHAYKTNVLSLDTGQSNVEILKQDFVSKSEIDKGISTIDKDTSQVMRQYGTELDLMKQNLPFFEECKSAKSLNEETEGAEEDTHIEHSENNCQVDIKSEYLNIEKSYAHTTMITENKYGQDGSAGAKISEIVGTRESKEFCPFQCFPTRKKKNEGAQKYHKGINNLDENILPFNSGEVSAESEKDVNVNAAVIEHDYSEACSFHPYAAKLEHVRSQISEDLSEKLELQGEDYMTASVETVGSNNIEESKDAEIFAVSAENVEIDTFNPLQNISGCRALDDFNPLKNVSWSRVLDMDKNLTFEENSEHKNSHLFLDKIQTEIDDTEQSSLYPESVTLDIPGQRRDSKPVQYFSICSKQTAGRGVQSSHKVASEEKTHMENDHVTLELTEGVKKQNALVSSNILATVTDTDNSAIVDPAGMQYTESTDILETELVRVSKTDTLDLMDIADATVQNVSLNDIVQISETDSLWNKDSPSDNEFAKAQHVLEGESLQAFKTESFLVNGTPCSTEKNNKSDVADCYSDLVSTSDDNSSEKNLQNRKTVTKTRYEINRGSSQLSNIGYCNLSEMKKSEEVTKTDTSEVADSFDSNIDSSSVVATVKEGVATKQSLGGRIVHVSSVTRQHVATSVAPAKTCATKSKDHQESVKVWSHSEHAESEVCFTEGSDDIPMVNEPTDKDSVKTEHLNSSFVSKDIPGTGTSRQIKQASDGAFHCDVKGCQFKTLYKSNASAHYQQVHLALKRYMCDQCTYATPNLSCLKHHLQLNHYKEKRFKCPDCDYLSLFHSDIVKHVRHTHLKQKQFACNQCEYRTGHTHSLKLHIMSHNGIRPYKCNACGYCANNSNKVTRHISLFHKDKEGAGCEKEDVTFEIDVKLFQCEEKISYQDIKVIELTTEEANAIMKEKTEKKEIEKQMRGSEKKAKAEKKATKVKKVVAKQLNKKSGKNDNKVGQDVKVITLTADAAKALMEAKSEKKIINFEEIVKCSKVLPKTKNLFDCDKNVTLLTAEKTNDFIKQKIEKNINEKGRSVQLEPKGNGSLQPRIIKMEVCSVTK